MASPWPCWLALLLELILQSRLPARLWFGGNKDLKERTVSQRLLQRAGFRPVIEVQERGASGNRLWVLPPCGHRQEKTLLKVFGSVINLFKLVIFDFPLDFPKLRGIDFGRCWPIKYAKFRAPLQKLR